MEFATYSDIEIVGLLGMQKLVKLEITEQLNEHGRVIIGVYAEPGYGSEQFCKDNAGNDIQIKVKQKLLFCGYITEIQDLDKDGLHIYEIELSSYSRKLDYRVKSRTYQNVSTSYEGVAEQIMKDYDSALVVWENSGEDAIGSPIFQYMETDWEFIKRLASTQGQSVITNVYVTQPYLMIDMSYYQYDTERDYRYLECGLEENGLYRYHRIECTKDYRIGTMLCVNEGILRVIRKHTRIIAAELRFEYILADVEAMIPAEIVNTNLAGLQLIGSVAEVMEDKVKVQIDIDKEWAGTGEYYFDWKPISSNIMYAMPEKDERVHVRLADVRGQQVSVINCMRQNGDTCADMSDSSCKIMQYENKKMKLTADKIDFSSFTEAEIQAALNLIDVEGIFAQVKSQMTLAMQKGMKVHSKTGKVTITTPFQIVLKDSIGDSDAEIAINQTIECQGDVVQVKAEARIDYPAINDAPVEITNRGIGKLLWKVVAAVVIVAVVAAVAAAVTVASGGTALGAIGYVVGCACIGGGITATFAVTAKISDDKKKGIKRSFGDYAYLFVDQFCTGAILAAPMATPLGLWEQLTMVGICSFTYQGVDKYLDDVYGGDFYDEDTNMLLNIFFDVSLAGIGSKLTGGLNKVWNKFTDRMLHVTKSETIILTKLWNKLPFVQKLSTRQADVNLNKKLIREALAKLSGKLENNPFVTYLILGGKEPVLGETAGKPGADLPTMILTDPNTNGYLKSLVDFVQNTVIGSEYDSFYSEYNRVIYDEGSLGILDFDDEGNLVFE